MSYARIRQLSAHEVGHTLGFTHNFAASTYDRGSVMDYPAPLVEIKNGKLDFSKAYAVGIGSFDKFATVMPMRNSLPAQTKTPSLNESFTKASPAGMLFLGDQDARPASAANPLANLWDNGPDPVAMLRHEMKVRRIGLDQFGVKNIPTARRCPNSRIVSAALSASPLSADGRDEDVGGVYYTYAVRTAQAPSPSTVAEIVPAARQREALQAVLETMKPENWSIADDVLKLLPPVAYGYGSGRSELFSKRTSPMFDQIGAAEIAADMAISGLLEPNRAARTISFNARNRANPHFREVVDALMKATWGRRHPLNAKGRGRAASRSEPDRRRLDGPCR